MIVTLLALAAAAFAGACFWRLRGRPSRWGWLGLAGLALVVFAWSVARDLESQKFVTAAAMPAGLAWLGLGALAAALWWRRQFALAGLATLAFAVDTAAGNIWLGRWLMAGLERQVPEVAPEDLPPLDAVIVLGGGTDLSEAGRPELGLAGDRLAAAVRVYHSPSQARHPPKLVTGGVSIAGMDTPREMAAETAALWRGMGIPEGAIVQVREPLRTTSDEIARYKGLIEERGWKHVGLVSSAWHLPRALALCRQHGLEVVPIPANHRGRQVGPSPAYLVPQFDGFLDVQLASKEYLGRLVGR
jgi:uncharacterized SAM-binding protein YcdF (DUF218 family)